MCDICSRLGKKSRSDSISSTCPLTDGPGVGVTKPFFSVPLFSHFFPNDQNSDYLYDIKFIFDSCHRSWAAETPGIYEHDRNYLTYTFAKTKFPVTEKLANGALVTPIPGETSAPLLQKCIRFHIGFIQDRDNYCASVKIITQGSKLIFSDMGYTAYGILSVSSTSRMISQANENNWIQTPWTHNNFCLVYYILKIKDESSINYSIFTRCSIWSMVTPSMESFPSNLHFSWSNSFPQC